jgi:Cu/Ag efflux protein CusF
MKKIRIISAFLMLPLGLSGCNKQAEAPKAETSADAMGNMAMPAGAKMAQGVGTVTAIDQTAGTITIDHQAIATVGWPAMTMGFSAKPELLTGVAVGDRINFDLTITGTAGEVTKIEQQ